MVVPFGLEIVVMPCGSQLQFNIEHIFVLIRYPNSIVRILGLEDEGQKCGTCP